ncbi:unnamed protein product, partial [Chrysoparadoxa australica]
MLSCPVQVLVHGLKGQPEDLNYLKIALDNLGCTGMYVHLAQANVGSTTDGVEQGGHRLANEIRGLKRHLP